MYMIGHLTYSTLNTGDMFWTLCGQNTSLLPMQLGQTSQSPYAFNELLSPSALIPQREQHIAFNAMQQLCNLYSCCLTPCVGRMKA